MKKSGTENRRRPSPTGRLRGSVVDFSTDRHGRPAPIGRSIHAGQVTVADGTSRARLGADPPGAPTMGRADRRDAPRGLTPGPPSPPANVLLSTSICASIHRGRWVG